MTAKTLPALLTDQPLVPVTAARFTVLPAAVRLAMPSFLLLEVAAQAAASVALAVAPVETTSTSDPLPRSRMLSVPASMLNLSAPTPPISVSLPEPPVRLSLPRPPSITLSRLEPVRLSLKAEPLRFSILDSVFVSVPPILWALVTARLTVTPAGAPT